MKTMLIITLTFMVGGSSKNEKVEQSANRFMDYCNENNIKAGLFYYESDSVVIKKVNF